MVYKAIYHFLVEGIFNAFVIFERFAPAGRKRYLQFKLDVIRRMIERSEKEIMKATWFDTRNLHYFKGRQRNDQIENSFWCFGKRFWWTFSFRWFIFWSTHASISFRHSVEIQNLEYCNYSRYKTSVFKLFSYWWAPRLLEIYMDGRWWINGNI